MATQALAANGAKVYITGRRMEALEQAAKSHSPSAESGGSIIPIQADITSKVTPERNHCRISKLNKCRNPLPSLYRKSQQRNPT